MVLRDELALVNFLQLETEKKPPLFNYFASRRLGEKSLVFFSFLRLDNFGSLSEVFF